MSGGQEIRFSIEPRLEQEGDLWTAYCDELGLASCGESLDEALENLRGAITAFGRALARKGLLQDTLDRAGIKAERVPVSEAAPRLRVAVPA
jgi:predicted RNase H-like HicB family nuclease